MLLHVSDPHFGTEQLPVVEALVRLAQAQRPQLVVLSGDITQRARPAQFAAARAFVDRLSATRVIAIPGNHDIPLYNLAARLCWPYAGFTRAFGSELEPVFESAQLLVMGVNTTRWYRHKNGEVSARQAERVAARLGAARRGQLRVVVTHQPIAVFRESDLHDRLIGHAAATAGWSAAGADLVLGGHIHLPYVVALHKPATPDKPPPGLPRRLWAVQAGTAVSSRVRGKVPNSVNIIRWNGEPNGARCRIERWDYAVEAEAFGKVSDTVLEVERDG